MLKKLRIYSVSNKQPKRVTLQLGGLDEDLATLLIKNVFCVRARCKALTAVNN
jgi:hypothetical protein